ncbi:hypothetical protein [Embleya sp. MST-111070]|uniref:hypothetical protein n=1 Tax=Embleya sp. MST-111070 TaxID=3398231 RepID=UPI003F73F12B
MQIAEPFHLLHHPSDDTWSLTLSDMDWRHLHSLFDALGFECAVSAALKDFVD